MENKSVYIDANGEHTFAALYKQSRSIGTYFINHIVKDGPVAVFCSRAKTTPGAFLGVVYSGRVYAPLDCNLPKQRLRNILSQMQPSAILADQATVSTIE